MADEYLYYFDIIYKLRTKGSDNVLIAICDDDKYSRDLIKNKVTNICPEAEICLFESGNELLQVDVLIDILFLDIRMQGENGIEIAKKLRKRDKKLIIIFVTALEEYVFQAFDVNAFHYLVKPIDDIKFAKVLCKAVKECRINNVNQKENEMNSIVIHNKGIHTKINIDDIVYAEVFNRKIVIHKLDSEIEYYGKMTELEKMVGENFFRPHRAYLVNFDYVEKYNATTIYLEKGAVLLAKANYPEFVKRYMKYNQRKGK